MKRNELRTWKVWLVAGAMAATFSTTPALANNIYLPYITDGPASLQIGDPVGQDNPPGDISVEYVIHFTSSKAVSVTKLIDNEPQSPDEYITLMDIALTLVCPGDTIAHVSATPDAGDPDGSRNGIILWVELNNGSGFSRYLSAQDVYHLAKGD